MNIVVKFYLTFVCFNIFSKSQKLDFMSHKIWQLQFYLTSFEHILIKWSIERKKCSSIINRTIFFFSRWGHSKKRGKIFFTFHKKKKKNAIFVNVLKRDSESNCRCTCGHRDKLSGSFFLFAHFTNERCWFFFGFDFLFSYCVYFFVTKRFLLQKCFSSLWTYFRA